MPGHHHHHPPPAIICRVREDQPVPLSPKLSQEYDRLYSTLVVRPGRQADVTRAIQKIETGQSRYFSVSAKTGVPWYIIGIIHLLECNSNFSCHLHNGDPLTHRTVDEPKNRPLKGHPPFSWEDSAVDALQYQGFDVWTNWSTAGTLYKLELYNGFGSRNHGVASPYLWGGTTFYSKGKYVKDHLWSPVVASQQIGAAPILRTMARLKIIEFPPSVK